MEPLPPEAIVDGAIMDSGAVIDSIQRLFQENKIKTSDVATGVSGNAVIVKKISLPQMSAEELQESSHWEAEQYIPFDIQDVNLDYQILEGRAAGAGGAKGTMDVLLVAAKKEKISDYTSVIAQVCPETFEAALRAAGANVLATDLVVRGEVRRAFCSVRPPGHHAERAQAMGFCVFNNVAVGAAHALDVHGLDRVAILDFDVHLGNGTEDIFRCVRRVLICSSFQYPLYPGSNPGSVPGHIVNCPLPPGSGSDAFRKVLTGQWLPALDAFEPQMVFISAGFDGHAADDLAELRLATSDYAWVTDLACGVAARHAHNRVVSTLEGGYDLSALRARRVVRQDFADFSRILAMDRVHLLQLRAMAPHGSPARVALESNDILFIDSSHVSKIDSDVNRILFDILPRLASGVHIHFHDILYPFEYPREWVFEGRAWNEAYILRAFLQFNPSFSVVLMNTFMHTFHDDFFQRNLPLCRKNPGGSIWIRKNGLWDPSGTLLG